MDSILPCVIFDTFLVLWVHNDFISNTLGKGPAKVKKFFREEWLSLDAQTQQANLLRFTGNDSAKLNKINQVVRLFEDVPVFIIQANVPDMSL